jgi:STE24 endopeptidase
MARGIRVATLLLLLFTPTFAGEATAPSAAAAPRYTLPPERLEKAKAFTRAKLTRTFAGSFYGFALLAALVVLRVGPFLRDRVETVSASPWVTALLFLPIFFALIAVLELPLAAWGHSLAVRFEQSIQGWRSWLADWGKGELVGVVISTIAALVFFAIVRASPERWWLWFWAALQPLVVFIVFVAPVLIDPLFFEFRPLADRRPELVANIERVLARAGVEIPRDRIFEMNASTKRRSLNAYVTGIGASKRVVVWDTALEKLEEDEILFVFGHELGHYALHHIPRTLAVIALALLPFLWLLSRVAAALVDRYGASLGLRGVEDVAALPLLLLVLAVASFFTTPLANAYSRWQEHDADVYGLEVAYGVVPLLPRAAAGAFQRLGEIGLADPEPPALARVWLYGHPPIGERLRFAAEYDPTKDPEFVGP